MHDIVTRIRHFATVGALSAGLAACQSAPSPPALPGLSVSTRIAVSNLCAPGVSPAIRVTKLPPEATHLRVRLQNISVLFSSPQDFEIPANGGDIPEGALLNYQGMCPAERQRFLLRFDVLALDSRNTPAAFGTTTVTVIAASALVLGK